MTIFEIFATISILSIIAALVLLKLGLEILDADSQVVGIVFLTLSATFAFSFFANVFMSIGAHIYKATL